MADVLKYNEFVKDMQGVISRRNGVTTFVGHRRGRPFIGEYDVNKFLQTPPSLAVLSARYRFSVVMDKVAQIYADEAALLSWKYLFEHGTHTQKTLRGFIIAKLYEDESGELPPLYTRCRWIASDGAAFVDADFVADDKVNVTCKVSFTDASTQFCGAIEQITGGYKRRHFGIYGNRFVIYQPFKGSSYISADFVANAIRVFTYRKDAITIADEQGKVIVTQKVDAANYAEFPACNFYLFARNSPNMALSFCKMRFFDLLLQDAETSLVKAHFIPALDANGVPCLYDQARKRTFYNSGGGSFSYEIAN